MPTVVKFLREMHGARRGSFDSFTLAKHDQVHVKSMRYLHVRQRGGATAETDVTQEIDVTAASELRLMIIAHVELHAAR